MLQTLIMLAKAARRAYFLSALDDDALAHEVSDQEASWVCHQILPILPKPVHTR